MSKFIFSLFISFSVLSVFIAQAQNQNDQYEDVIYMKNGSILRGRIIEQVPTKYIKIEIVGGSVFVSDVNDIDKIVKEESLRKERRKTQYLLKEKGYFNNTELGVTAGNSDYETEFGFMLRSVNGYRIRPWLNTGLGLGINAFKDIIIMPVTADLRAFFGKKKVHPFVYAGAGYGVKLFAPDTYYNESDSKGGFTSYAGAGWAVSFEGNEAFTVSVGYMFQKKELKYNNWGGGETIRKTEMNRITLSLGMAF